MMEKNKFLLLTIMLVSFLFVGIVAAKEADDACSSADLSMLNKEAANIKVTYVPVRIPVKTDDPETEGKETMENVLDMKVFNMTDKFILRFTYSGDRIKEDSFYRNITHVGKDGAITIRQHGIGRVINYAVTVISSYGTCSGREIRTIRITLPKFNYYSTLAACKGIQDYYLCQPYITSDIDTATFYDKVEQYKAKLLDNSNIEVEEDNNSVVSEALTGIKKNKYLVVGIIVAIGVITTIVILKRKKSEA